MRSAPGHEVGAVIGEDVVTRVVPSILGVLEALQGVVAAISRAQLRAGGLDYKGKSTLDDNGWGQSKAGEWGWNTPDIPGLPEVKGLSHTRSWFNSEAQEEFFLRDGGEHAALVTGVLPDGEVLYTQHTPGAQGSSLQGRVPNLEQNEGRQQITVVRPKQTW